MISVQKPVRVFRHTNCSNRGHLCHFLEKHEVPYEIACVGCEEGASMAVPASLDDVSGLIFMGGPGDVNSSLPWMQKEIELIQRAVEYGTPVMGVCLGAQMISKALGGEVSSDYELEVGWHKVEPVVGSDDHFWFQGLPTPLEVFQWHAHDFTLPPGATSLLSSRCTPHQAFSLGNILAMQFHMEITVETVRRLRQQYAGDMNTASSCVQDASEMCQNLDARVEQLHRNADLIYLKWLQQL